jgi:hypothetical protein
VVAAHHGAGRISQDSIEVVLVESQDRGPLTVTRFDSQVRVSDRIDVLFDREDPSTIVQEGYGLWGTFELLMLFFAIAGLAFSVRGVLEVTKHTRRRSRPVIGPPAPTPPAAPKPGPAANRNPGVRRRRHRRR